jgi:hypothetical protein
VSTTWPPTEWVPRAVSPGVMWPGPESDCLLVYIAEVRNEWSCTVLYAFVARTGTAYFTEVQLILRVSLICLAEVTISLSKFRSSYVPVVSIYDWSGCSCVVLGVCVNIWRTLLYLLFI